VGDVDLAEVVALGEGDVVIPTLADVLQAVPLPLMVDFTRREVVAGALEAVQSARALQRCLFVTGNVAALQQLRAASAGARIGLTWLDGPEPPLALLHELRAEYWNPMFGLLTAEGVDAVHQASLRVSTWTVDSPEDMTRVLGTDVDAIVSNRIAALVAHLGR
jgi:glycerophosphoryl diester phosphodiesterase